MRMSLLSLYLNSCSDGKDLMELSKVFQLFIQNRRKLLSYLSVMEKGDLVILIRTDALGVICPGIWSNRKEGVMPLTMYKT